MKLKIDFITNSSSTAFFFIFKGKSKKNLFEMIKKYSKIFNLEENFGSREKPDFYKSDHNFVITEIDKALKKKSKNVWESCKIELVDNLIESLIIELECDDKFLKEEIKTGSDLKSFYEEDIKSKESMLITTKTAKRNGLTHYLKIEFGDNHGHITGTKESTVIDYLKPKIIKKDFVLLNEGRH